jgi:o-succinylbenzoate---CoA ligase
VTRELRIVPTTDPNELLRALRDALTGDGPAVLPRASRPPVATSSSGTAIWDPAAAEEFELSTDVPRAVSLVIETSGSTGAPKRVALSTDALLASAAASASALGGQGQWLLALPAHYVAGAQVLIRSIVAETEPLALAPGHFDPRAFCELAAAMTGELRFVSLVPVQLGRLVDAAAGDSTLLERLRRFDGILVGGQRLPADLGVRATELGLQVTTTYGSSETSGGCVYNGIPIGNTRVRAVDGELEISGAILAEEYLGDAERTASTFHTADGARWYRTGDLGQLDGDRVVVAGRADNVIISGGEKVLLDAVEHAVRELAGCRDAVVVSAASREWGQVPVVVVAASAAPELADVREHVSARLGRAAAPARILTVDRIPMLDGGKPDRVGLAKVVEQQSR